MTTFADLSGKARRGTRAARPPDDIASFRRLDLSDWNSTLRVMGQRKSGGTGPEKGETAEALSPPASLEKGSDPFIPFGKRFPACRLEPLCPSGAHSAVGQRSMI